MIDSGKLRHRVQWVSVTEQLNNTVISNIETDMGTFWAFVQPTSSQETAAHNKVQSSVNYTVTMRKVGDIKQKDKLIYNGRKLQVQSVINTDEQNYELILQCVEVVA